MSPCYDEYSKLTWSHLAVQNFFERLIVAQGRHDHIW